MIRQIAYGLLALLLSWQAIMLLAPVGMGLVQRHTPTGDLWLGIATVGTGLACAVGSAWCLRHSAQRRA